MITTDNIEELPMHRQEDKDKKPQILEPMHFPHNLLISWIESGVVRVEGKGDNPDIRLGVSRFKPLINAREV